jgi:hypothetical protein
MLLNRLRQELFEEARNMLLSYVARNGVGSRVVSIILATFGVGGVTSFAGGAILMTNPVVLGAALMAGLSLAVIVPSIWEAIHDMTGAYRRRRIIDFLQGKYVRLKEIDQWVNPMEDDYYDYFTLF